MLKRPPYLAILALALIASASTWFYFHQILRAQQLAEAAVHDVPRGNLSDLYPRWLGARELLKHGRNPYSPEITREIQQGYYGRSLDPSRPDDPKDQQGFAYPVYVVFLMAPTVDLPFETAQTMFRWLLIALSAVSAGLWLRALLWKLSFRWILIFAVLMLGWIPVVQAIKLQQLSLLVAGLFAACAVCLSAGWLFLAGGLLALATIKPQLAWPVVLWLLWWALVDWRVRRRFVFGFALVMLLLLGGAELLLPGWLRMFYSAIHQYHQYTRNQSMLTVLFGMIAGRLLGGVVVLACAVCLHRVRRESAATVVFGRSLAVVLALTVVIVPMFAIYNQVLLLPAILSLLHSYFSDSPVLPVIRRVRFLTGTFLVWPWVATLALSAVSLWLTAGIRQKIYLIPFFGSFMLPIFVFALALGEIWANSARNLRDSTLAE